MEGMKCQVRWWKECVPEKWWSEVVVGLRGLRWNQLVKESGGLNGETGHLERQAGEDAESDGIVQRLRIRQGHEWSLCGETQIDAPW